MKRRNGPIVRRQNPDRCGGAAPIAGKATIHNGAATAAVSVVTVSHVLDGAANVAPETIVRVRAVVTRLYFAPSAVARNLYLNRTNMLGLLFPEISGPFFSHWGDRQRRLRLARAWRHGSAGCAWPRRRPALRVEGALANRRGGAQETAGARPLVQCGICCRRQCAPIEQVGRAVARPLIDAIRGAAPLAETLLLPVELVIRESFRAQIRDV